MRDLRRIRDTNNQTTACTIATSLIHSHIDYLTILLLLFVEQSPMHLIYDTFYHVTPSPIFNSPVPDLSTSLSLKK